MKIKHLNLIGEKYGRWTVINKAERRSGDKNIFWICKCECGNIKEIRSCTLRSNQSKSCGCLALEVATKICTTHGLYYDNIPEYRSWRSMKDRCNSESHKFYKSYGGRGIMVCDKWNNSFGDFLLDMGKRPSLFHSLDRIDNNKSYEPSNCKWSTKKQQGNNRRTNKYIIINGVSKTIAEWILYYKIEKRHLIYGRIKRGWEINESLFIVNKKK